MLIKRCAASGDENVVQSFSDGDAHEQITIRMQRMSRGQPSANKKEGKLRPMGCHEVLKVRDVLNS